IRHVEDSGMFLTGYSGILQASGAEGAYDYNQADAVNALAGAQFGVAPVLNPSAYIQVNDRIHTDVQSVAAALPNLQGTADAGDGRAAVAIASIRNSNVMVGKSRTFDDYFADSVTNVGLKGEQAANMLASQNAIMNDLTALRDSISGVNIDEELADIIKFQHGYNAAARFISVQDELLDTLINRLGV
ncbi:MAG TPA: flagellar hook-associated protein FlgK, partial [Treponema sp.]|nr:flagellar hook-associated protein FlgK [Treponema sp.]